jgi:hypothetical protein
LLLRDGSVNFFEFPPAPSPPPPPPPSVPSHEPSNRLAQYDPSPSPYLSFTTPVSSEVSQ